MVSFRRIILALAVLALFTGLASAQVNVGGSGGGALVCTANVANPTAARAEGYAELLGDIVIQCTGGTAPNIGQPVPTANITVALNNTLVTSRILDSTTRLSEALLLIDEPGAGAGVGPGGVLPQTLCSATTTQAILGAGPGGCPTVVGVVNGNNAAVLASNTAVVPNVFQGVNPSGSNQVVFNGIPILAPTTTGLARVFRITNIRGNAAQFAGQSGSFQGQIPIQASITISNGVLLQNPVQTTAFLFSGLGTTSVRNANSTQSGTGISNILQCGTSALTAGAVLRFPEGFAAAFKSRVAPTSTYSGAATFSNSGATIANNLYTQNIPGTIYNGSESGFILNAAGGTAGLADFGTRLKATFNNVPSGVNIFVSTANLNFNGQAINNTANYGAFQNVPSPLPFTGNSSLIAGLVTSETATSGGQGGFLPLQSGTNNNNSVNLFGPLPVDANGTATAVWEILNSNPSAPETADFAVYYSYTGNPATNVPPTTPVGTVSLSFAPTYTSPTASGLVPRFVPPSTSSTIVSVALCQTTLLYPFVSAEPGFDTGLAIANTSSDPFGTKTQSGTCTLNYFGSGAGTTPTTTTPTIAAGTVYADEVSNLKPGFRGYVIAVCNFQLAHGYALFSDTGIRNWATGYVAQIIPTGTGTRNTGDIRYGGNGQAVEGLEQ
jgi:hypothetical protein